MAENTRRLRYDGPGSSFRLPAHDISVEAGETFEIDAETAATLVADTTGLDYHDPPTAETTTDTGEQTETFDTERWLAADFEDRATAVRNGDVDNHLDAVVGAETSQTVVEAVTDRRDELETRGELDTGSAAATTDTTEDVDTAESGGADADDPAETTGDESDATDTSGA